MIPESELHTSLTNVRPSLERWSRIRALAVEVFGYGWVSATALAIDASLLKVLVTLGGWNYLIASTVSFIVGAYVVYALSVRFVFRFRQIRNRAWEFGSFIALGIVGLLVNAFVLSLAISVMGWGLITAKLGAALCTFATNFILRRGLLFSPKGISK